MHSDSMAGPQWAAHPAAIEAATEQYFDEDEFSVTNGYDTGSAGSTQASMSVYAHTYEHGRRYQIFKNGRYPIPNDDDEQNREDMKHAMLLELTDGKLFYAPIGDHPQLIVDVGTGSGIWAIDVGDRYPSARVRGMDLSPIQPVWVPPNVDFLVDDCEREWLMSNCDLVHLRFTLIVLREVPRVLQNAYQSLRPGGWIELQELDGTVLCDDGTMPNDDPVKDLYELGHKAFLRFGMDTRLPSKMEPLLHEVGFRDIHCKIKKVPIGVWAKDKTMRLVGMYQKIAVEDMLPVLAGRPFEALGLSPEEIEARLALAHRGLTDAAVHRYFNYYFWYAQKPTLA